MGSVLSFLFGFIPMLVFSWVLYWLDRFEKEPWVLLGLVFIWGALVAAGVAFIVNTLLGRDLYMFTGSEVATEVATGLLVAPPVEETLKGLAVLLVFLIFRPEFDSTLDGIVYAGVTALGFAATENTFYIYQYGYLEGSYKGLFELVFIRVFLVGWQHPFYTAFIGIGLAKARFQRNIGLQLLFPSLGWGLAVALAFYAVHNTLANLASGIGGILFMTALDWFGWFLMFLFILWTIYREKQGIKKNLAEEVTLGVITPSQHRKAHSARAQFQARVTALFSGNYRATHRFYSLTAELAHKKEQHIKMGEESGNTIIISRLREELLKLSAQARS
jgi:RsiW-degrading membrane proteinase PrsW (M82 family)